MASVNKVTLIGYLGKDPESRSITNGRVVCNFTVATYETWKDKSSGEKKDKTEWHRITAFGRLGEICGEYLIKGTLVYIDGKLATRKWTDKEGVERYTTEITADTMKILSGRGEGNKEKKTAAKQQAQKDEAFDEDDIPF